MAAALPLVPESCVNPSQRLQLVRYGSGYSWGQLGRYRSLRGQVTVAYPVCAERTCLYGLSLSRRRKKAGDDKGNIQYSRLIY